MFGDHGFVAVLPYVTQRLHDVRGHQRRVARECKDARCGGLVRGREQAAERSSIGPAVDDNRTVEQRIERTGERVASGDHRGRDVAHVMIHAR